MCLPEAHAEESRPEQSQRESQPRAWPRWRDARQGRAACTRQELPPFPSAGTDVQKKGPDPRTSWKREFKIGY